MKEASLVRLIQLGTKAFRGGEGGSSAFSNQNTRTLCRMPLGSVFKAQPDWVSIQAKRLREVGRDIYYEGR